MLFANSPSASLQSHKPCSSFLPTQVTYHGRPLFRRLTYISLPTFHTAGPSRQRGRPLTRVVLTAAGLIPFPFCLFPLPPHLQRKSPTQPSSPQPSIIRFGSHVQSSGGHAILVISCSVPLFDSCPCFLPFSFDPRKPCAQTPSHVPSSSPSPVSIGYSRVSQRRNPLSDHERTFLFSIPTVKPTPSIPRFHNIPPHFPLPLPPFFPLTVPHNSSSSQTSPSGH